MREALTLPAFARLVGATVEELESYRAHRLLDLEGDGLFDDLDVIRLDIVRHHLDGGWTLEQLAEAVDAGTLVSPIDDLLFDAGPTYTIEEAAEAVGADVEQLRALGIALGFSETTMRARDREMLDVFTAVATSGLPWNAIVEGARVMGDTLRRLAETEVRLVHVYIHERLLAEGVPEEEISRRIFQAQEALTPLLDPLIQHVHRQHLLQAAIEDIFLHLTSSAAVPTTLGSVEATIVFADIASFTALADSEGDEAAAKVLERLEDVVRVLAYEHDGKVAKHLGDGFMLVFRWPRDAVRFAVALQGAVQDAIALPPVRVGINTGNVLHRAGEYVGSAVNLASRVSDAAMPEQILLTDTVVSEIDGTIPVERVGVRLLRGVDRPLELWRVVQAQVSFDPVCGASVGGDAVATLNRDGHEYAFCSEACLRRFVENPSQYAAI
jgi:adenylate cyclase